MSTVKASDFPANAVFAEDNAASVSYAPASGAWSVNTDTNLYTGGSYHLTYTGNATATFRFSGSHVWVIADKNADHGKFSVSLDGNVTQTVDGHSDTYIPSNVLFESAVTSGQHILVLTNLDDKKGLGVDQFVTLPAVQTSTTITTTTTTTKTSSVPTTPSTTNQLAGPTSSVTIQGSSTGGNTGLSPELNQGGGAAHIGANGVAVGLALIACVWRLTRW